VTPAAAAAIRRTVFPEILLPLRDVRGGIESVRVGGSAEHGIGRKFRRDGLERYIAVVLLRGIGDAKRERVVHGNIHHPPRAEGVVVAGVDFGAAAEKAD